MDITKLLQLTTHTEMRKQIWETITTPLTEETREIFRKEVISKGLKFPNPEFGEDNLRYDINYLNQIGAVICMLPLEFIADYVDRICKEAIDENSGIMEDTVIAEEITDDTIREMDATALGNTAYIILNTKNEMARHKCLDVLYRYMNFYLDNLMNMMTAGAKIESEI